MRSYGGIAGARRSNAASIAARFGTWARFLPKWCTHWSWLVEAFIALFTTLRRQCCDPNDVSGLKVAGSIWDKPITSRRLRATHEGPLAYCTRCDAGKMR